MGLTTTQRLLIALATLLLLAGVVVLVTDDDDAPTVSAIATPGATSAPTAGVSAPPATAAPGRPTAGPATAAPEVTQAPSGGGGGGGGQADPAPRVTAPKPGTYRYKQTESGQTSQSTLTIASQGGGKQTETLTDGDGQQTTHVEYRQGGKYDTRTVFGQPPQALNCDWKPDLLEIRFPVQTGARWAVKGSCSQAFGAATIEVSIDGEVTVRGKERTRVGGTAVDVWVGHFEGTIAFETPNGQMSQKVTSDDRIAPDHGLVVRSTETTVGPDPQTGQQQNTTTTRELVSLTPA